MSDLADEREDQQGTPTSLSLRLGNRISKSFPSVTERYYKPRFLLDANGQKGHDQCALFHSNRIVLITLAPSHPILKENKAVTKVDYQVNEKLNRLNNQVSGKWKKGGQKLQKESALCIVTCSDGQTYTIVSTVPGSLIEVNEHLTTSPERLTEKTWSSGYIAIVLPPLKMDTMLLDTMTSPEDYVKARRDVIPKCYITDEETFVDPQCPIVEES
ncbi:protein Abitram isoform X3 [Amblyomma americanum]